MAMQRAPSCRVVLSPLPVWYHHIHVGRLQEKLDAAKAMQRAIVVAQNSTAGVAEVAAHFETLQVADFSMYSTSVWQNSCHLGRTMSPLRSHVETLQVPFDRNHAGSTKC